MKPPKKHTRTASFGSTGRYSHNSDGFYNSRLYKTLEKRNVAENTANPFPRAYLNKIICANSERMVELPDRSVHLMITSPPYNVAKEYDQDMDLGEYLDFLKKVFAETHRVLVPTGRACVNIANVGRKPYIPLSDHISRIMEGLEFRMRGEIIWDKASSAGGSTAWGSWRSASNPTLRDVHEYIMIFSKGGYKRERTGKDTIERDDFLQWTKSVWSFPTASAKKVGHPSPYPVELPHRLIQLFSFEGDVVLDPFMGSGTTGIAALKSARHFVGYETQQRYVCAAQKRILEECPESSEFA